MKFISKKYNISLKFPFTTSRGSTKKKNIYIFKIIDDKSTLYGLGEVIFYNYYGQTLKRYENSIKKLKSIICNLKSPNNSVEIRDSIKIIQKSLYGFPEYKKCYNHLISAIDCALWDLTSKKNNLPLFKFIEKEISFKKRTNVVSSFTIGLDTKEIMIKKLKMAKKEKILKIKLSKDVEFNKLIINEVRKITNKPIRLDPNTSWGIEEFIEINEFLKKIPNIEFIEQPIKPNKIKYNKIFKVTKIPIILDESIVTLKDINNYKKISSGINIKLSKCGGLTRTIDMIRYAKRLHLKIMIGSMIETSVGINYGYHLAPYADYVDLDGNILTKNDPFKNKGNYRINNGRIIKVASKIGLGI